MSSAVQNDRAPLEATGVPDDRVPGTKGSEFCCDVCQSVFSTIYNLRRHMKKIHPEIYADFEMTFPKLKCPECEGMFCRRSEVRRHLSESHGQVIECEHHAFSSIRDFYVWKEDIEKQLKCFYRKSNQYETREGMRKKFLCHRSGKFKSKSTGRRNCKSQGSRKMNACCPAEIILIESPENIQVQHWKSHVGHTNDLKHLNLTRAEKQEIAKKIEAGVSLNEILDDVKGSSASNLERKHLISKRDLHNIRREFNILSKSTLQSIDNNKVIADPFVEENGKDQMSCNQDGDHKRVIKLPKKVQTLGAEKIMKSQTFCSEIAPGTVLQVSDDSWLVTSMSESDQFTYKVIRIMYPICGYSACEQTCKFCRVCAHMFHCECSDNSINCNMCKHIHTCVQTFPMLNDRLGMGMSSITNNNEHVQNHTDPAERFRTLVNMFSSVNPANHTKSTLNGINYLLMQGLDLLNSDKRSVPVVVKENGDPANKKIDIQKGSGSTRRKRKLLVRNSAAAPSSDDIKQTLEVSLLTHDHKYYK